MNPTIPAFEGHPPVCKCLLANGAEVNTETPKEWYTALMFGTIAGMTKVTGYFPVYPSNPSPLSHPYLTPLSHPSHPIAAPVSEVHSQAVLC